MIRLSCWIGAMGCTASHDSPGGEKGCPQVSVLQPFTRCIETDVSENEHVDVLAFPDASARLAHHFQSLRQDCGTSLDEVKRFLDACKGRLLPGAGDGAELSASGSDRPKQAVCHTDS